MQAHRFFPLILSVVPGLGHLYLGRLRKAIRLLFISAWITLSWVFSKTILIKLLMVMAYLVTAVPAAMECWQISRHRHDLIFTNQRWYITLLLLVTGFSALPLMWASNKFSKTAKILWTIAVPVLAVAFFSLLAVYWDRLEGFCKRII